MSIIRRCDSAVGILTAPRAGWPGLRIPPRTRNIFFTKRPDRLWGPLQPPIQCVPRSHPEIKLTEPECNLSLPGTAAIKNEWSHNSVPPACLLGVDRDFICTGREGISGRSGNSGYPRLGDTGASILQKASELSSSITANLLWPVVILIASSVKPLLCVFKKSIFLQASRPSLSTQLLLNLLQFSILRSNEQDFNCQVHCGWCW